MNKDQLGISNSLMFAIVMQDEKLCIGMLNCIFRGRKVKKVRFRGGIDVERLTTEATLIHSMTAKAVRLDVLLEGSDEWIDLEMQVGKEKDLPKRTRYIHSEMDQKQLGRGANYGKLKQNYVIFICLYDPIGEDRSLYSFSTREDDSHLQLGDERYTILLNTKGNREDISEELGQLLDYIENGTYSEENEYLASLDKAVEEVRNSEVGDAVMTLAEAFEIKYAMGLEEGKEQGLEEGRAEGREQGREGGRIDSLKSLVEKEIISIEQAAEEAGMMPEEFRKLLN